MPSLGKQLLKMLKFMLWQELKIIPGEHKEEYPTAVVAKFFIAMYALSPMFWSKCVIIRHQQTKFEVGVNEP